MFVTNGREGNTFALLALTDPAESARHRGMSCFIVEKGAPGLEVVKSIAKLGYKGVDTAELFFDAFPCPAANLVGGVEGRGFKHVMSGLETGRINIAARAVGVAQAALDEAPRAARGAAGAARGPRATSPPGWSRPGSSPTGRPAMKDRGERCDLEAGMAKLYASEAAQEAAVEAMRIEGRRGQLARASDRAALPRHAAHDHRRGHQRDPATHHRRNLLERYGERPGRADLARGELRTNGDRSCWPCARLVEKDVVPVAAEQDAGPARSRRLSWRSSPSWASSAPWPAPSTAGSASTSPPRPWSWRKCARGSARARRLALAAHLAATLAIARSVPRDAARAAAARDDARRAVGRAGGSGASHRRAPRGRRTGSSPGLRRCRAERGQGRACSWSTPALENGGARRFMVESGPAGLTVGRASRHRRRARARRGRRGPRRRARRRPGAAPRRAARRRSRP